MNISLNPKGVLKTLVLTITLLLLLNIVGLILKYGFDHGHVFGLLRLIDFNSEMSIPAFYSACALALAALVLATIAIGYRKISGGWVHWAILSVVFLYLAIDEIGQVHERTAEPLRNMLGTSGLLFYAWVIPYGLAALLLVALYARWLFALPSRTRWLFILGGTLFVSGAVGLELLEGMIDERIGIETLSYAILYTIEELMEMLGIAIFIYGLLTHIVSDFGGLNVEMSVAQSSS